MRMELKISRNMVFDRTFHRIHVFSGCYTTAVTKTENMGINGLGRLLPPHIQHHIGRLQTHSAQRLLGRAGIWDDTIIFIHHNLAHLHDVLGLLPKQANSLDMLGHALKPEVEHLLGRIGNLE